MKVAAIITYGGSGEARTAAGPAHRVALRALLEDGRLLAAGPFAGDAGALWILQVASLDKADALLRADPFAAAGVFEAWRLQPLAYWSAKAHKGA